MKRTTGLLLALVGVPLFAGSPKVGGKLYIGYFYEVTDGENTTPDLNYFKLTRFYFTVKGKHRFSDEGKAYIGYRLTTDAKDINGQGYYEVFVKYAYLEVGNLVKGLKVRLGQVPTPWTGYEERTWGFRFTDPVMVDRFKYMYSTDRGIGILYESPKNFVNLAANLVNGEGYHKPEVTKHKDAMARVSIFPLATTDNPFLKGFHILAYAQKGYYAEATVRDRYIVGVAERTGKVNFMLSYFMGKDGPSSSVVSAKGISAHGFIDFGRFIFSEPKRSFGVFFRYDMLDPDVNTPSDGVNYMVGGVFVRPCLFVQSTDRVILAVNVARTQYEDANRKPDMLIRLNSEIRF